MHQSLKYEQLDDCSNDYLEYVFDQMCDDFKKLETVHLDETPLGTTSRKRTHKIDKF